jgi:hypothetical protein
MTGRSRLGKTARRALSALALAIPLAGCAKAHPIDVYFPLHVGNEWHYDLVSDKGATRSVDYRIVGAEPGDEGEKFLLASGPESYFVRDDRSIALSISPGIWTIFLDGPLTLGHRFDGGRSRGIVLNMPGEDEPDDPRIRAIPSSGYKVITGFDRTVKVAAGTFRDCLEVSHIAGPIVGVRYFAPKVGLVYSESWLENGKARSLFSREELASFHVEPTDRAALPERVRKGVP